MNKSKGTSGASDRLVALALLVPISFGIYCLLRAPAPDREKSEPPTRPRSGREVRLTARLDYLLDIPEVQWTEVDGNTVYIGFREIPADLKDVCNAAAANGNRAISFGVHVWAVPAASGRGWRPGDGPYYYETTARYGSLE